MTPGGDIPHRSLVRASRGRVDLWLEVLIAAAMVLGGFGTGAASGQTRDEVGEEIPAARSSSVSASPETPWRASFRAATDSQAQEAFLALMVAETDKAGLRATATATAKSTATARVRAQAYLAVGQLLVGSHRRNVFSKWRSFRTWTSALEGLIRDAPDDPELRFLRLTVQSSAPGFLGYSGDLETDCRRVNEALESGYWKSDPGHADFVQTTTSRIQQCLSDQ